MDENWNNLIIELDELVVSGNHTEVHTRLQQLNLKRVPRNLSAKFAEFAWRVSSPLIALKILHPFIYPENQFDEPASDLEKNYYSAALANLGAINEANKISANINTELFPEALLTQAIAYFKIWDYEASVPLLKKYIHNKSLTPYKLLIGQVNLAAAFICLFEFSQAEILLKQIESECQKNSYLLLLGNCYELKAQIEFFEKRIDSAIVLLEKALLLLKNQNGDFSLYAQKWLDICHCSQNPTALSLRRLATLKENAKKIRHWETVRECDLFKSLITQDEVLAKKVIRGSPYEDYRKRVRKLSGKALVPPKNFHWMLNADDGFHLESSNFVFDPYEKQSSGNGLFETPMLLTLFKSLTDDFYKPSHIGLLFEKIYINEEFNPFTSPDRVLKLIKRLNKWFTDNAAPLRVNMKKSEFSLTAVENIQITVVVHGGPKLSKDTGELLQLKEFFKDRSFSAQQVATKLNISRARAQTIISHVLATQDITKLGTGRATLYRLNTRRDKKQAS